ncbi:hypothetical protein ACO0RG_003892 [Hanseniaspora osmophila]
MSAPFMIPGTDAASTAQEQEPSMFAKLKATPLFTMVSHGLLFAAGVAFIQSPLMDSLAPQL